MAARRTACAVLPRPRPTSYLHGKRLQVEPTHLIERGLATRKEDENRLDKFLREATRDKPPGTIIEIPIHVLGIWAQVRDRGDEIYLFGPNSQRPGTYKLQSEFSYTFHKSQGVTILWPGIVVIDLDKRPAKIQRLVTHAAIYVALSRVQHPDQLFILPPLLPDGHDWLFSCVPNPTVVDFVAGMKQKPKEGNVRLIRKKVHVDRSKQQRGTADRPAKTHRTEH